MSAVVHGIGIVLLLTGTAFCVIGIVGVMRMPDFYNRIQAAGIVITMGAGCVFLSLLFLAESRAGIKGVATAAFLALTSPMVAHVLARTAYRAEVRMTGESVCDELAEDLQQPEARARAADDEPSEADGP
jgi:multicomponent Na+:H+ antiporter subunit G